MDSTKEIQLTLERYCEYLNSWSEDSLPHHEYKPEQFLIWDPDNGMYGKVEVLADVTSWYRQLILEVSDGDDGGPAIITTWIAGWEEDHFEPQVVHIVQEFDTYIQTIYDTTRDS